MERLGMGTPRIPIVAINDNERGDGFSSRSDTVNELKGPVVGGGADRAANDDEAIIGAPRIRK